MSDSSENELSDNPEVEEQTVKKREMIPVNNVVCN